MFLIVTIVVLALALAKTTRQLNEAQELNFHRGTFDSIEKLHYKIWEDNNIEVVHPDEAEFLYKFNGEIFSVHVIADKWDLNGSRELVLTYNKGGQRRLLRERKPN